MIKNDHNALLQEFGQKLGLDLHFNENRICELYFDNSLYISIRSEDYDGNIIISTILCEDRPESFSYNFIIDSLNSAADAYLQGGNIPQIGRDEETGFLIAYIVCSATYLAQGKLIDIFTDFIEYYQNAHASLKQD
ncbi:MAG: type III secretion system chaperone [Desulfovibrio sp.]|nr:type III secretion system chaperone [Desulfovibrio sp.]